MGKIDDMRKMREKQFADAQQASQAKAKNGVAHAVVAMPAPKEDAAKKIEMIDLDPAPVPKEQTTTSRSKRDEVTEARCPACGKIKGVQNGVMVSHQKGLGKMCPGSRKEPS
ncbi:MAG: hypothetical protein ABI461_15835 [Polyangiaceae bacterium]